MLRVNEIFTSIQGEGVWTGVPAIFLRLQGCNLNCPWCDTQYALKKSDGDQMTAEVVADKLIALAPSVVVLTGGEPMLQGAGIIELHHILQSTKLFHLETNGTLAIPTIAFAWVTVSPKPAAKFEINVDPRYINEIKMVISVQEELEIAREIAVLHPNAYMSLQPESNREDTIQLCIEYLLNIKDRDYPHRWRLSLQTHKLIGVR